MTQFIGISGHLTVGATGHFESFHKALFDIGQENPSLHNCTYLGSQISANLQPWFKPVIPNSLTASSPWSNKSFGRLLLRYSNVSSQKTIFHVYEGNLYWVLVLSNVLRRNPKSFAYVNLFQAHKYNRILYSRIKNKFFTIALKYICTDLGSRMIITADTRRLADKLSVAANSKISFYPMYSILNQSERSKTSDRVLVVVRGEGANSYLFQALELIAASQRPKMTIHGVFTLPEQRELETRYGAEISKGHLNYDDYLKTNSTFYKVVLLYDPSTFKDQSSSRLCDAAVTMKEIVVPMNTSLQDMAEEYGEYERFDFEKPSELGEILSRPKAIEVKRVIFPTSARAMESILSSFELSQESSKPTDFIGKAVLLDLVRKSLVLVWIFAGIRRRLFLHGRSRASRIE